MSTNDTSEKMEAMAVWESHLQNAADRWKQGVETSEEDYRKGFAEFLGISEDEMSNVSHRWEQGVTSMSADEFRQSIRNEGADWLVGLYESVTDKQPSQDVKQTAREVEQQARERAGENASGEDLAQALRDEIQSRKGEA